MGLEQQLSMGGDFIFLRGKVRRVYHGLRQLESSMMQETPPHWLPELERQSHGADLVSTASQRAESSLPGFYLSLALHLCLQHVMMGKAPE